MFDISFLHSYVLYALPLCVAVIFAAAWLGHKMRTSGRARFGEEHLLARNDPPDRWSAPAIGGFIWSAAISLVLFATAAPVLNDSMQKVAAGALDVVIVSDVSRSMAAEDYRASMPDLNGVAADFVAGEYGSRLGYANHLVVSQIMPAIEGNRLGFVGYAGSGWLQCELTEHFASLRWIIENWVKVGSAPGEGSNFAAGLNMAIEVFDLADSQGEETGERQRVIVLFSDGGFTGERQELAEIADKLKEENIELVIVGLGDLHPVPIPVYLPNGEMRGYLQRDNQPVLTSFESENLSALQTATSAEYIRVLPGETANLTWASILAGNRVEIGNRHWFQVPLFCGMAIIWLWFFAGMFVSNRKEF